MEATDRQDTVFDMVDEGRRRGMFHQFTEDTKLDGKHIQLHGRTLISFGSCSYLGLETDERLKEGVRRAVERYGTQFSASRAYLSSPQFVEFEACLETLFGGNVLPTTTTTLGHLSTIPVLCGQRDAILMDQMVHHSVQMAATQARAQGTKVELIRHADWQALEAHLEALTPNHQHVWYLFDGVYSMFGDLPDVKELKRLLDRFPTLHLYVDDAHGMSIAGEHGRGMHLARMGWHPRTVLATSFAKAFASGGGCIVFPDAKMRDRVRLCGGPYTFGGPLQPPMLGASLASAKVHLSDEITVLQADLRDKLQHFNAELKRNDLPLFEQNETPIFFIKCGPVKMAQAMTQRLFNDGYFLTAAQYPAVPLKVSGLRIAVTRHHTKEDLTLFAEAMARNYPQALADCDLKRNEVEELFAFKERVANRQRTARLSRLFEASETPKRAARRQVAGSSSLKIERASTINELNFEEWDSLLGGRNTLRHSTLANFERIFQGQPKPENNWNWHYFIVRDGERPVAATFFTEALWKDDMLMRAEVSNRVEAQRAQTHDPYLLTSRALGMGTLLTEGNHLMLDRSGPWREALRLIINEATTVQAEAGASSLVLRDLPDGDQEMDQVMLEHAFLKVPMLASHVIDLTAFSNEAEFLTTLGSRTRRRVRAEVLEVQQHFTTKLWRCGIDATPKVEDLEHYASLYQRVKQRKRRLNTFDLPTDIFGHLWSTPGWELMSLHLSPAAGGPAGGEAVACAASCVNGDHLVGVIAGLDGVERELSAYRQLLWRMVLRGKELGMKTLELGMDAEREKARMGAVARPQCSYVQVVDHSSSEILEQLLQDVSFSKSSSNESNE